MPIRQLQDSGERVVGITRVLLEHEGGTGADNPEDAVNHLRGVSRDTLDQPDGIAQLTQNRRFPLKYFEHLGLSIATTLQGPLQVTKGITVEYLISNYDIALENTVEVTPNTVTYRTYEDKIEVDVPSDASGTITILINNKPFNIEVVEDYVYTPTIFFNADPAHIRQDEVVYATPPKTVANRPSNWVVCPEGVSKINLLNSKAYQIAIKSNCRGEGQVTVFIGNRTYKLPKSNAIINIDVLNETEAEILVIGDASVEYSLSVSSLSLTSTHWQVATDEDFNDIVYEVDTDTMNLTSLPLNLSAGDYYIRCRYTCE